MQDADRERFVRIVRALAAVFRAEVTTALFEGYWFALEDLSITAVEQAARECLRRCKFMSSPSEIREFARPSTTGGYAAPYHIPVSGYDTCAAHLYHRQPHRENECRKGTCPYYGQPFVLLTDVGN